MNYFHRTNYIAHRILKQKYQCVVVGEGKGTLVVIVIGREMKSEVDFFLKLKAVHHQHQHLA